MNQANQALTAIKIEDDARFGDLVKQNCMLITFDDGSRLGFDPVEGEWTTTNVPMAYPGAVA